MTTREREQQMAGDLLRFREQGYALATAFKLDLWKFLIMYAMTVLMLVASIMTNDVVFRWVFVFLFGFFCGGAVRDLQWIKRTETVWPFRKKVLDWDKVEAIAADDGLCTISRE